MRLRSPQPNLIVAGEPPALTLRFWVLLVATGVLAGLAAGLLLLLLLLRLEQHTAWA